MLHKQVNVSTLFLFVCSHEYHNIPRKGTLLRGVAVTNLLLYIYFFCNSFY